MGDLTGVHLVHGNVRNDLFGLGDLVDDPHVLGVFLVGLAHGTVLGLQIAPQ